MLKKIKNDFSGMNDFFKIIFMNKQAAVGFIILLIFILMAVFGPIIIKPQIADYANRLQAPSFQHWLGTDFSGKDTFKQFVLGSRDVLSIALFAGVFTIAIGVIIGISSGLIGGLVDEILMMITNVVQTIPNFPVLMVLSLIISANNTLAFGLILSLWSWSGLARAIRAQTMSLKHKDFIEASRLLGMGKGYIIVNDILPNIIPFIAVNFIMVMKSSIMASVGLMVLGLAPFSGEHWGIMLDIALTKTGALLGSASTVYLWTPIVGIVLFQLSCYMLSKGIEEAFNPRIRTSISGKKVKTINLKPLLKGKDNGEINSM